jgi:hypothetical protein
MITGTRGSYHIRLVTAFYVCLYPHDAELTFISVQSAKHAEGNAVFTNFV